MTELEEIELRRRRGGGWCHWEEGGGRCHNALGLGGGGGGGRGAAERQKRDEGEVDGIWTKSGSGITTRGVVACLNKTEIRFGCLKFAARS
jgi:hypothetical protein